MAANANTGNGVEVGFNKYGQRLDEFNEFGQSLEAEAWHFDGVQDVPVVPAPALERMVRPAQERTRIAAANANSGNGVEVGLNKYGQRLDEFNEFGLSLEAEAWHFDGVQDVPVMPAPALERMVRPVQEWKLVAAGTDMPLAAAHRRAA